MKIIFVYPFPFIPDFKDSDKLRFVTIDQSKHIVAPEK